MPRGAKDGSRLKRTTRTTAFRVTLLAVSTLSAVAIGEIVVRAVAPAYTAIRTDREMWDYDPMLGWRTWPSIDVLQIFDRGRRVPVSTNSHGFRESETQPQPRPGTTKIMVLGDSFAFGWGVRVEDRLTEVMERARPDIVCQNFGVSGYSTDQELLVFRGHHRRAAPDIVVLMYVANDPRANASRLGHAHPKPVFSLEKGRLVLSNIPVPRPSARLRLKWTIMRSSALFNLVRERTEVTQRWISSLAPSRNVPEAAPVDDAALKTLDAGRGLTRRLILELRNEVEHSGARLMVVNSVSTDDLEHNDPEAVRLGEWCRLQGIEWVDTYPAFRRQLDLDPAGDLFLRDRHHWNSHGHRLAAGCLLEALEEAGGWRSPESDEGA